MKFPTPLKGWRVFAGEVGVIVLGVLLALGAQQAVENIKMRADVREFRRTIDHEIGLNLYFYEFRGRGSACNERRITELTNWIKKAREGQVMPAINAAAPSAISPYRSAWDSRDGEVFANVPQRARQKYAEFYDELSLNREVIGKELDEWIALQGFAIPGPVTLENRREIYRHLRMALIFNKIWGPNTEISRKIADELGINPIQPDNVSAETLQGLNTCPPAFAAGDSAVFAGQTPKS